MLEQLLDDYNYYRFHTGHVHSMRSNGRRILSVKLNKEREASLAKMQAWCGEHDIDPRLWLYSLFKARRWMYSPRFDQLIPGAKTKKKAIARYLELAPSQQQTLFQKRVDRELAEGQQTFDPNRDISRVAEELKRKWVVRLNNPEACLEDMENTYGYHPQSLVCARCPLAAQCAAALQQKVGYDIQALRRGDMTAKQAMRIAHGGANNNGNGRS